MLHFRIDLKVVSAIVHQAPKNNVKKSLHAREPYASVELLGQFAFAEEYSRLSYSD